jgi:hypothetical protein
VVGKKLTADRFLRMFRMEARPEAPPRLDRAWWSRLAALAALALLALAAAILAARRLSGGFARPPDGAVLILTGAVAALAAVAARVLWRENAPRAQWSAFDPLMRGGPLAALLALGLALTLPRAEPAALIVFWVVLAAEEVWSARWARERSAPAAPLDWAARAALPEAERADEADVLLRMTRVRDGERNEVLRGSTRAEFQAGQRAAALHLAFCPPFAQTPELEAFQIEGPETRVKIGQVLPYGARLDLRLIAAPSELTVAVIEFAAVGEALPGGKN